MKYDIGVQVTSFKLTVRYYTFGLIVFLAHNFIGLNRLISRFIFVIQEKSVNWNWILIFWKEKKLFCVDWKVSWCVRSIIPLCEQAYLLSVQCTYTGPHMLGFVARTPYILSHIIECMQHVKCNTMDSDHCCRRSLQPIRTVFLPLFVPCSNCVCVFFFFKAIKCITVCKHIFIFHAEKESSF